MKTNWVATIERLTFLRLNRSENEILNAFINIYLASFENDILLPLKCKISSFRFYVNL